MPYESVPPESLKEEPSAWASPELRESMEGAWAWVEGLDVYV
jgi:hypothetical protein